MPFPTTLEDEFGDIIQKARQGWDLTIEDVAVAIGVSPDTIKSIEDYELTPETDFVNRLSVLLDLDYPKLQLIAANSDYPTTELSTTKWSLRHLGGTRGAANCYILGTDIRSCVVVDPSVSGDEIIDVLQSEMWRCEAILLTHNHHDHVAGLTKLSSAYQCPVISAEDASDSRFFLGEMFRVLPTPGHTRDSVSFVQGEMAFVGDLVFAGSIGRARPENYQRHLQSVLEVLKLPKETIILPGHGPITSVQNELVRNPFVR